MPLVYSAYFWFKEDATKEQIETFVVDSEKRKEIKTVSAFILGAILNKGSYFVSDMKYCPVYEADIGAR